MTRCKTFALGLVLLTTSFASPAADSVSGHYRMDKDRFNVAHGLALPLWKDAERESYGVLLSAAPINPQVMIGALDPLDAAASGLPEDSGALLLTVVKDSDGSMQIASIIARPDSFSTNGDGEEQIRLEGDRIRGTWTKPSTEFFEKSYEINLQFDLPLTVQPDPGAALPADGGEPGKVYLAFLSALAKKDTKGAVAHMAVAEEMLEILGVESLVEIASMNHPVSAEILGGWMDGDRAQLRVKGTHSYGQTVRGRVEMKRVGEVWKVGDSALR